MIPNEEKNEKLKNVVGMVNMSDISSIQKVVSGIIKIIEDPDSTARDLKGLIEVDPPLSAKLLKLANSAYYAPRQKIYSIEHAVIWIGFDVLKELALSQKVCEIFNRDETIDGYSRASLWKHSVAVACLAKMIFRREFEDAGEGMYAAGLLHDIGIIVEDQFFQYEFSCMLIKSNEEKKNLQNSEHEIFGYNHAEIGKELFNDWKFPLDLVMAIGYHHSPFSVDQEFSRITKTLYVADYLCQKNGIGYGDAPFPEKGIFQKCLRELSVKSIGLDLIVDDMKQEIAKMEDKGLL